MALTKVPSNLDATVATTQSASDNSTNVATTAYVTTAIANLSDSAPAALNTLNEIAAALGDDANYASTTTAAIAAKLPLAGGTMSGGLNMGSQNIISAGTIGIGHNSPSSFSSGANNLVVNDAAGAGGITIVTPNDAKGSIFFADGTGASGQGRIRYNHDGDYMTFGTSGTEDKVVIDSSGMLLVNTTSSWGGETTPHIESRGDVAGDYTGLIVSNTNDAASDTVSVNFGLARDGGLVFGNAGKITVGKEQDWTSTPSTVDGFMSFSTMLNESLTEKMRIDSSGNVGIGITPKTDWHTGYRAIQIGESSAFFANTAADEIFMVQNARYTSGGWKYNSSGTAALFDMQSGNTRWRRAVSGSDNGTVSWSDSMIILGTNGNVGIGTTSPGHQLDISNSGNAVMRLHAGASSSASLRLQNDAQHWDVNIQTNDKFAVYDHTTNTQPFTILPTSGNVGIGTATPASHLEVFNATAPVISLGYNGGSNNGGSINWNLNVVGTPLTAQIAAKDDGNYRMNMLFSTKTSASGSSGMTERMRIASNGDIHFKCGGSQPSASVVGWEYHDASGNYPWVKQSVGGSGNLTHYQFYNTNGAVGQIYTGGSSTTYSTSSDYRLKENVDYTWDATTLLKQLKPCKFNFIKEQDGEKPILQGFLAHEVSDIVPGAVRYTKDAVDSEDEPEYQTLDHSKLVPLLVKTIQELEARIATLEG